MFDGYRGTLSMVIAFRSVTWIILNNYALVNALGLPELAFSSGNVVGLLALLDSKNNY